MQLLDDTQFLCVSWRLVLQRFLFDCAKVKLAGVAVRSNPARFFSSINLVDPASSHMLVSKIKPCMSQYKLLYGETANGSLKQL